MKIVKELKKDISIKEIKEIYERGNKVGFTHGIDLTIFYINVLSDYNEEYVSRHNISLANISEEDFEMADFVYLDKGKIKTKKDTLIVLEKVECAECAYIKPFVGKYKDLVIAFHLYDYKGNIADRVYEVEC
jgi:hypothetical protein